MATAEAKFFAWDGDPGSIEAFKLAGFRPVVLGSVDIVPSLQTGMITCVAQAPAYVLTARLFEKAGAKLNVAVVAAALDEERRVVPLDQVYPRSVAALHDAVEAGAYEPVCHGYLHLDPGSFEAGEVEFREFGTIDFLTWLDVDSPTVRAMQQRGRFVV